MNDLSPIIERAESTYNSRMDLFTPGDSLEDEYVVDLASLKRCIDEMKTTKSTTNAEQAAELAAFYINKIETVWENRNVAGAGNCF